MVTQDHEGGRGVPALCEVLVGRLPGEKSAHVCQGRQEAQLPHPEKSSAVNLGRLSRNGVAGEQGPPPA